LRHFDREDAAKMNTLDKKVAVVTGGTSGIGARIAEAFIQEGARVVIGARREDLGRTRVAQLGPDAHFVRTDVAVEADIAALISSSVDRLGRLDCLVNNAGAVGGAESIATLDVTQFQEAMAVHAGGVAAGMKHAAPVMCAQGSGSIINVASIAGHIAGWTSLDYSAAKAAILHMTRSAAVELGEHNVRVNSISPGPILTGIFAKAAGVDPGEADQRARDLEPVFRTRLADWQAIRRVGVPHDVAPAAVWLASNGARFVTGQDLAIDGGITAGRPSSVVAADRAAMGEVLAHQK
jgi:NAD(P)-dependent dehydrogenase (short-subunit alcohol dehydrogenase family)